MTHSRTAPAGRPLAAELSLAAVYLFYCRATPLGPFIARSAAADLEKSFSSTSTRLIREERFGARAATGRSQKETLAATSNLFSLFSCVVRRDSETN
jgi:hypothetical protein